MPDRMLMRARTAVAARRRRGQSAVLIAMVLFVMLLLVAMSTNIGIAVNDKIRMQSTADLSTYAVAYSEAATLNELVGLNKNIVDAVQNCRTMLLAPYFDELPCACRNRSEAAEGVILGCKATIDYAIGRFVERANYFSSVQPALQAGRATALENFTGVTIDFFQNIPGSPTAIGTFTISPRFNSFPAPAVPVPSIADFEQVTDTGLNYMVTTFCGVAPECVPTPRLSDTTYVNTWFYKETRDPDVWVAGRASGTPEKQYLDTAYRSGGSDGGYFGASSTGGDDKIFAYSVAKPYEGSVGPTGLSGNQANANGERIGLGVFNPRAVRHPEFSMYDEYRARLAGTNEGLVGDQTPSDLIQMDGWLNGKTWDMSKFEH